MLISSSRQNGIGEIVQQVKDWHTACARYMHLGRPHAIAQIQARLTRVSIMPLKRAHVVCQKMQVQIPSLALWWLRALPDNLALGATAPGMNQRVQ